MNLSPKLPELNPGALLEYIVLENNKLKKITDQAVIWNLLNGAKVLGHQVFIWRFVGNQKHLASVKIESVRKQRKDFCIIPGDDQGKYVEDLITRQETIDIYIPESSFLMRCEIKQSDAPVRYYLAFPVSAAQMERRKNLRLNIYASGSMKATFSKSVIIPRIMTQFFDKTITDISVGGFSFFVSRMEHKFFQEGDPVPCISLQTAGWSSRLDGIVTSIREINPDEFNGLNYKAWRISCRFRTIDLKTKCYLEKYIFERINQELSVINR